MKNRLHVLAGASFLFSAFGLGSTGCAVETGGAAGSPYSAERVEQDTLGSFAPAKDAAAGGVSESPSAAPTPPGVGDVRAVTPGSECATASASVAAPPVHLVFMIDRSGSMGDAKHPENEPLRWAPVAAALRAFFAEAQGTNVYASIAFFGEGTTEAVECSAATYARPSVAMTTLPSPSFGEVLDATKPGGGTPTKPALEGAIAYAQELRAGLPANEKVAIVLATDGEPNDCGSTPANVAAAAATVAATIPTYVIGVGPDPKNLDEVAASGGTGKAIMIPTTNPAQVSADLRAAVGQIKGEQLGCSYALPAPPAGQTLDVNAVNVDYAPAGGATQRLPYSADCADASGWHYDDLAAPNAVILCASSCSTVQGSVGGGKVEIVFGCAIQAPPGSALPSDGVK